MSKPLFHALAACAAAWLPMSGCHHSSAGSPGGSGGATAADPDGASSPPSGGGGAGGGGGQPGSPPEKDAAAVAVDRGPAEIVDVPPVVLATDGPTTASPAAVALVAGLSLQRFRDNIKAVAAFGDRLQGSPSFDMASAWLDRTLAALGYTVEHHAYTFQGGPRINTFVTKLGKKFPDRMFIVSAHLDGRGGGGGADDDGSGVSLVLELARAFAAPGVETDVGLRFAFWCNEETGMDGSHAYVRERAALQGKEDPPGSGKFPEPRWLGMIQHDMMLYDHGLPPGPLQRAGADINIDYQVSSAMAAQSRQLAEAFAGGARTHAHDYPPIVGTNMEGTDSVSFQDATASISVREARRIEEIIRGSNPNHHKPSDVYESYSDLDFQFGFNAMQTTMGSIADLAGAHTPAP
jgi:hypothetical protein